MTGLLDVNVLVALAWPNHLHHAAARAWWSAEHTSGWATCPVTELGFVRLSSTPAVVDMEVAPRGALDLLARLTARPGHEFWADDARLVTGAPPRLATARQVTDAHLLVLAAAHGGRLVTFDRGIVDLAGDDRLVWLLS